MSSKTKIVVLRMKEIIYTAIFIGLGLLLIALLLIMFRPGRKTQSASAPAAAGIHYLPGMYSSTDTWQPGQSMSKSRLIPPKSPLLPAVL